MTDLHTSVVFAGSRKSIGKVIYNNVISKVMTQAVGLSVYTDVGSEIYISTNFYYASLIAMIRKKLDE